MAAKKTAPRRAGRPKTAVKKTNFSVRLPDEDVNRVAVIAAAREWPMATTIQKLVRAALDAKVLK
jgi:hypothetical protein